MRRPGASTTARIGIAAILLAAPAVSACTMHALSPDTSSTSAIAQPSVAAAPAPDTDTLSDENTVRNAVSSADPAGSVGKPIAWANADTGSRGSINTLVETKERDVVCRQFTTTRESFEGVALYHGKACMTSPGLWSMTAFSQQ